MDNNPQTKKCTKPHCKTLIPAGGQHKLCDTCRTRERDLKWLGRARAKAAKEAKEMLGKKHAREDGQANGERAARRARSDEPGELLINTVEFDEDDDDGLPFRDSENTVCLLVLVNICILVAYLLPGSYELY